MLDGLEEDATEKAAHLVTSCRVSREPGDGKLERLAIFNRGGLAGTIVVEQGDGELIAGRLLMYGAMRDAIVKAEALFIRLAGERREAGLEPDTRVAAWFGTVPGNLPVDA